jgi:quinol monooxygenase YgiN
MVTVIVEGTVKDNDKFDALMKEILGDTRSYDGCKGITVERNTEDAASIVLIERWESRDHYDKYLGWRQETGVLGQIVELLEGPPNIRYFEDVGV